MLRTEIENYIRDNGLEETVRLFGFQANPYPFMLAADLLVCSSDYEGYSTFITEGVILQKRILTTDCSGMHDILDKYSAGRIVANSDEAFFKGLVEYFQQPEEITGRIPDSTIFSTQQLVKENESFFEALVKNQNDQIVDFIYYHTISMRDQFYRRTEAEKGLYNIRYDPLDSVQRSAFVVVW